MSKNYFEVLRAGINTTFQDLGRKNLYHIGIPFSGVMDNRNFLIANKLVGNKFNSPVIEFAYQGPYLKYFGNKINISITGDVNFIIKKKKDVIDGICYKSFSLEDGDEIDITSTNKSVYGYLAISGELDIKYQWSSCSTNTKANIGANNGKKLESSILDGNCKLQWKVDWAMRWYALDIDFEMYGKDLIESAILSTKIINLIGKKHPSGFAYELFLDEKGEKISKSKGNGITIDQWLKYASPESLSLYMYQNPKRAKKLYKEIVPKAVDEYLDNIEKSKKQTEQQLVMNPVWHVHNGNIPKEEMIMTFSMLLNLVETSNADNKDLLWKFVKKYKSNIHEKNFPIFDGLVGYAIKYFNDVIKAQKKYKNPSENEKLALQALVKTLEQCNDQMSPEDIQTLIYSTGKENGYAENLRDWFKLIYEVVFGDENGPRMGFFISFFGVNETKELIISKLK